MRRDLVEQAMAGDHDAFGRLVATALDRSYGVARLIFRDPDLAHDAVQQAFIAAWRDLSGLRDPDRFDAWLARLLVRSSYREARRRQRFGHFESHVESIERGAPDESRRSADRDQLERGFRHLDTEQRAILVLHFFQGLPLTEVAGVLAIPAGTVKARLHQAMQAMRATLESGARGEPAVGTRVGTNDSDLGRRLTAWFDADASDGPPAGLLEMILVETATTPRRPAWRTWRVSRPRYLRLGRTAWRAPRLALVAAIVVATVLAVAGLPAAGPPLPPPVGPARTGLIALDDGGDILLAQPDGSGRRPLTSDSLIQTGPSWSPDGTRIAYWVRDALGHPASLWVMNADGSGAHDVTGTTDLSSGENILAAWSPDSRRLAFSVGDYYSSMQLYVAEADARGLHAIGSGTLSRADPSWSPDGRLIAFRGQTIGMPADALPADPAIGVYVIAPDGTGQRLVSHGPRAGGAPNNTSFGGPPTGTAPSWSPDGGSLAYAFGPTRHHAIAIGAVDGSTERMLATSSGDDLLPVFSPDGTRIAWEHLDPSGKVTVRTIAVDGSDPRVLGGQASVAFQPLRWSPDGRLILAYSPDLGSIQLLRTDGSPTPAFVIPAPDAMSANGSRGRGVLERASWQRLAP